MWRRWPFVRQTKLNFLRFIRLRGTPEEVAKGFALGIFIGMTPTFGVQMPIAFFFAWLLRENKLAAIIGVWVTNPLTAPFIYASEYEIGRLLRGMERLSLPTEYTLDTLSHLSWNILAPLCAGSLIFAILFGLKFFNLGPKAFSIAHLPWTESTMIYYSVVTFTTLGFGDIVPKTPEAAWWVMAEVVLGYIMLGGLISIFATKLSRRS